MTTKIEIANIAFFLRGEELSHFSPDGKRCRIYTYFYIPVLIITYKLVFRGGCYKVTKFGQHKHNFFLFMGKHDIIFFEFQSAPTSFRFFPCDGKNFFLKFDY